MEHAFWKNPIVIAIANFLLPGAGYIALGRRMLFGFLLLGVSLSNFVVWWLDPAYFEVYPTDVGAKALVDLGFLLFSLAFAYDGYQEAKAAQ